MGPAVRKLFTGLAALLVPAGAIAGAVTVVDATVNCRQEHCRVSATLRHADSGWDHYADRYVVLAPDGSELGRRVLLHPHVDEQPFTRGLGNLTIPVDIDHVFVFGHDKVHGDGEKLKVTVER
jgi:hypothetical protein